jgi:hypothetical protein
MAPAGAFFYKTPECNQWRERQHHSLRIVDSKGGQDKKLDRLHPGRNRSINYLLWVLNDKKLNAIYHLRKVIHRPFLGAATQRP